MAAFGTFDSSVRIRRFEGRGTTARVAQTGVGPDIVWIPGGDSPAEAWRAQMAAFADRYRSTTYDPRGVGETVSAPAPWRMEDFAADCAEIIEACCEPPVVLAGLSMGALVTQQVAIDRPDLVRLAIPMGTAAYIDGFTRDWMQAEIDLRREGVELPRSFLAPHYAAYALPASALGDPDIWEPVKEAYTERFADRRAEDLIDQWQACLDFDCRVALASCPVPIHAIGFAEDVQTPPRMVKLVAELARDGHYHELAGLGHVSLTRHRPDLVNRKIAEILEHAG